MHCFNQAVELRPAHPYRTLSHASRALARLARPVMALLVAAGLTAPMPARAQGGPAEAVSAGAAVAGVVVSVIGGLSSWVNDQSDDCAAAALGAAWGKDCDLNQKEASDTGWSSVFVTATGSNGCAYGHGQALAQEGLLGSWSYCNVSPWVLGFTRSLHTSCDNHAYKAWAKASVDGKSEASTASSPGAAPFLPGREGLNLAASWPPGTVLAIATIDTLTLDADKSTSNRPLFKAKLRINGNLVWAVTAQLDNSGRVTTSGPLSPQNFRVTQDRVTGKYTARLLGYHHEIPIDTLAVPTAGFGIHALASDGDTETTVDVSMESEMSADGDAEASGACTAAADVTCTQATTTTADGTYAYVGQNLNVLGNLTIAAITETFPVTRLAVTDGLGTLWVVDPFHATDAWRVGDRVRLSGVLTQLDGDPVLTNTKMTAAGAWDPKPIDPQPIVEEQDGRGGRPGAVLDQNAPNPFNPTTAIRFSLAAPGPVALEIYSIAGQLVRRLVDSPLAAGSHEVVWDGRDADGRGMPSGIYFYRLAAGDRSLVRRMIMTK